MNYFWIIVGCIEVLAVGLLLFGLLTACVARWRKKNLAFAVLAFFALCVVGASVLAIATGYRLFTAGLHFNTMKYLLIVTVALSLIGYIAIARIGWRRRDQDALPAAATWPRSRLLVAFLVALSLSAVTHWNVTLSVQQRLAREEVDARVMALSVMPGRPIDSHNAAVLYEPVFERLRKHHHDTRILQDDWLDFDKPLDTDDPVLRELLASHRQDLDALVNASTRLQCYFGIRQTRDFLGGNGEFSWIEPMHIGATLLAIDTRVSITNGDLENAVRSTSALFRLARHTDQTPILFNALISCRIEEWAIDCLQALLNHPDLSASMCSGLLLDTPTDYRRSLRRVSAFEEAGATTFVQRFSPGFTEGVGQPDTLETLLWSTTSPYFIEHELDLFRSAHRQLRVLLDRPWPEVIQYDFGQFERAGVLASDLMGAYGPMSFNGMIGDTRYHQARLAIAMRRYELEQGDLPESFDDLVPSYIDEIPLDPTTEKPFKMENVEGGVRLYSAEIESWDPEEYHRGIIKDADRKVEMFLKSRE